MYQTSEQPNVSKGGKRRRGFTEPSFLHGTNCVGGVDC